MNIHNNKLFIEDTNKLMLKNKKINIKNNESILKNKFWMDVYEKMKAIIYNYKYQNNITYKKELYDGSSILNNIFKSSGFISQIIIDYIKKHLTHYYLIEFDNNTIYYFVKSTTKLISNKTNKDINELCRIIYTMKILFNRTNKNNKQTLYYFPTSLKKKINKDTHILGINECNTGYSYLDSLYDKKEEIHCCHPNGNIHIFRKEEHYKVLIHELIHACYKDQDMILSNETELFSKNFCVNKQILLNESYTETIATILNLFYLHIILYNFNSKTYKSNNNLINKINNKKSINKNKNMNILNLMYINETKYSFYTMAKILNFYKINSLNDFTKYSNQKGCNTVFLQETNVFSYYIVKPLLLYNINDFASFLTKYTNNFSVVSQDCVKYFSKMILNIIHNDKNIQNIIKMLLLKFKNCKNKSLRLTLYEMNY
jgi:hypothetical protein